MGGAHEPRSKMAESYLVEPDESCKDYIMQQTMLRIKDPKISLEFYSKVLGMR